MSSLPPSSMIFDRSDLRVLRLAFDKALVTLEERRVRADAERLASTVFAIGWAKIEDGESLRGAGDWIANEAASFLETELSLSLCA